MKKKLFFFIKKFLFPGLDISTRKRMKFTKYFRFGDIETLDVGCGNGAFSFAAYRLGNKVLGIDFNKEKLRRTKEFRDYIGIDDARCEFKVWSVYDLLSLNEKFDQIICFETLEHIKDDLKVIDIFAKILKPGGLLHLCTPYANRKPYYGEIISEKEDGNHIRLGYTFEQFEEMLKNAGFEIVLKDWAVGLISQKLINLMNRIDLRIMRNATDRQKDLIHLLLFLIFYPFTFLDNLLSREEKDYLNIYVLAKKI